MFRVDDGVDVKVFHKNSDTPLTTLTGLLGHTLSTELFRVCIDSTELWRKSDFSTPSDAAWQAGVQKLI